MPNSARKCVVSLPIMSGLSVTPEDRFGVSLNDINGFKYKLTHLVLNQQRVRAKWEVEWQTPEQFQKARKFLLQVLANKEVIQNMATRTEIRPIPAQWKYLMKKLQEAGAFREFIQQSFSKWVSSVKIHVQKLV